MNNLKKSLAALTVVSLAGLGAAAAVDAPTKPATPPAGRPPATRPSRDVPADQEAIQGTWQSLTEEMRGQPAPGDPRDHQMVFSGNAFKLVDGDQMLLRGTFRLDPTRSPKVIEMKVSEGAGGDAEAPVHGIYELNGDQLKWCSTEPGSPNGPKEFKTKGTSSVLIVLKRPTPVAQ
jgi:uncharacterized protein (TIGR03067 family)